MGPERGIRWLRERAEVLGFVAMYNDIPQVSAMIKQNPYASDECSSVCVQMPHSDVGSFRPFTLRLLTGTELLSVLRVKAGWLARRCRTALVSYSPPLGSERVQSPGR
jgi:hypothetical protein